MLVPTITMLLAVLASMRQKPHRLWQFGAMINNTWALSSACLRINASCPNNALNAGCLNLSHTTPKMATPSYALWTRSTLIWSSSVRYLSVDHHPNTQAILLCFSVVVEYAPFLQLLNRPLLLESMCQTVSPTCTHAISNASIWLGDFNRHSCHDVLPRFILTRGHECLLLYSTVIRLSIKLENVHVATRLMLQCKNVTFSFDMRKSACFNGSMISC